MISFFQELFHSLRNNKLRSALTAFSIAWGIIILILLLGSGKGVENGIRKTAGELGQLEANVKVYLWNTEEPYAGYQAGRSLSLKPAQLDLLREMNKNIFYAIEPVQDNFTRISTTYGVCDAKITTLSVAEREKNSETIVMGRTFTPQEMKEGQKVILLSEKDILKIFANKEECLNSSVLINGIMFKVIGVRQDIDVYSRGTHKIPFATYANMYPNDVLSFSTLMAYPHPHISSEKLADYEDEFRSQICRIVKASPDDYGAMFIDNPSQNAKTIQKIFSGIQMLLWIIGIGTLTIGVVGVSNIMQVTVQERFKEIGIRKALGAKPYNILALVLGESIILSVFSGMIGLLAGVGLLDLIGDLFERNGWGKQIIPNDNNDMAMYIFSDPQVDLQIAFGALIVLIIAGIVAGYAPARKAIKIPAIVAMRDMK